MEPDLPLSVPEFDWQAFTTTKQTELTGYSTVHTVRVKAPSAPSNILAQFSSSWATEKIQNVKRIVKIHAALSEITRL